MAIIPAVPGIQCSLHANNSEYPLPEYPDDRSPAHIDEHLQHKTASNYVQSPGNDSPFHFNVVVCKPYKHDCDALAFKFIVDDEEGHDQYIICLKDAMNDESFWDIDVSGFESQDAHGNMVMRGLKFANLEIDDDARGRRTAADDLLKQTIGFLKVEVYRHKFVAKKSWTARRFQPPKSEPVENIKKVSAKLIKGQSISQVAHVTPPKKLVATTIWTPTEKYSEEEDPIAIFRFKYRSKEDLQREHILPRTPSPSPASQFRNLDDGIILSLAENQLRNVELLRSLQARQKRDIYVEKKFEDLGEHQKRQLAYDAWMKEHGRDTIKLEFDPGWIVAPVNLRTKPLTVLTGDNGQTTIDLTDEDDEVIPAAPQIKAQAPEVFQAVAEVQQPEAGPLTPSPTPDRVVPQIQEALQDQAGAEGEKKPTIEELTERVLSSASGRKRKRGEQNEPIREGREIIDLCSGREDGL